MRIRRTIALLLLALTQLIHAADPKPKPRWEQMDYGPFLSHTFGPIDGNWVLKGTLVRLDKEKQAYALYDTEMMRVAAVWTGGFIDGKGVVFDGDHHQTPGPAKSAKMMFTTKPGPGWAKPGTDDFTD